MKHSSAVYGIGTGINGQEAAMQATQRALDLLSAERPVLAIAFAAQEFNINEVLAGLASLLGDTPLFGISTTQPLAGEGNLPRSVLVALITGSELKAQVHWFPGYAQDSLSAARHLEQILKHEVFLPQEILLAADGVGGSLAPVCAVLGGMQVGVSGGMAAGDPALGKTNTIGKNHAGPGALAAALLSGGFRKGVGLGHGWRDLGVFFRVTRSRDVWLHTLDGRPAAEIYAQYFGYPAREWAYPPLSEMARLYPLGVEGAPGEPLELRSALRVEVDGSLRMSTPVPEGAFVHLMTADPDACLEAARSACRQALKDLGGARPLLAVALADAAWQMLFEARPDPLAAALKDALGDLPVVGGYTFGQVTRPALDKPPALHNQNIAVIVLGEG